MNRRSSVGSHQNKNRAFLPQKLRHFFSSFPDACEFPALPDWLLRRPMGSVWCVPKSPSNRHSRSGGGGGRNRIEPTIESSYRGKKSRNGKSRSKVADLTYKNTWSSFLKSSQSDKVTFYPTKSPPLPRSSSVRFDQSWDDAALDSSVLPPENMTAWRKPHHSSSPIRRRSSMSASSSAKMDARKFSRIESKALREAWLNEDVFPTFGVYGTERSRVPNMRIIDPDGLLENYSTPRKPESSRFVMNKFVSESPGRMPKNRYYQPSPHSGRKADSLDANVSYGTTDTFLTPDSMEVHGTSTLATTSAEQSLTVNPSSATGSFDSVEVEVETNRYSRSAACSRKLSPDSLDMTSIQVHNSSDTSQSVEVQVSSTLTNSSTNTSMAAHISSGSSGGLNGPKVSSYYTTDLARELLLKERAISSANSRKSCLKEKRKPRLASFKDPCRFDWTKRYLYTLAPRPTYYEPVPRSTSMSRVSSSSRDYQVYTVLQQRPWQSSPDLRGGKLNALLFNESLDLADLLQKKKKQFLAELLRERNSEDDAFKSLKKEMRSLLRSSSLPRCLSAGRSPSTEQALVLLEDDDSKYRKDRSSPRTKVTEYSDGKEVEPHDFKKKHGSTTTTSTSMASARQPFHFSNDNLTRNMIKMGSSRSEDDKTFAPSSVTTPSKKMSRKSRSPDRRPTSSVKFDPLASFSAPLQPASGENKASALRKSINRKKCEEQQMQSWQDQEKERERRQRLRALRLDPAWSQVRGADQALEDIEHRRCYKEVVERERLLQYYMDRDEMMARVWQMPPLFERQKRSKSAVPAKKLESPTVEIIDNVSKVYTPMKSSAKKKPHQQQPHGLQVKGNRLGSARERRHLNNSNDDCYLANESLQLSRPSTAKSTSIKSCHQRNFE